MKKICLFALTISIAICSPSYGDSLTEISKFAQDICDQISFTNIAGDMTRKQIEGKLTGEAKAIEKLLGISLEADGKVDNTQYKGLPYDKVAENVKDARECKQQLAKMLVEERSKIDNQKSNVSTAKETLDTKPHTKPVNTKVIPRELSGRIKLSRANDSTEVCLRFNKYPDGLPEKFYPVFVAWTEQSAEEIPMVISTNSNCQGGYILPNGMPSISQGGTLHIDDSMGQIDYVLVGRFSVEKGTGCTDVGLVESWVIKWQSNGSREAASSSGIPISGDYGWICKI